jgi:hypothetical protein
MAMSGKIHVAVALSPGKNSSAHWIGRCVGLKADGGFRVEKKSLSLVGNRTMIPRSSNP